jgi:hypothetical protein
VKRRMKIDSRACGLHQTTTGPSQVGFSQERFVFVEATLPLLDGLLVIRRWL